MGAREQRQCQVLESFCAAKGWPFETIRDLRSGMNDEKKGLRQLLKRICAGQVDRLLVTHKDRLLRLGAEQFGTEVVIINARGDSTYEEDLASDVHENAIADTLRKLSEPHLGREGCQGYFSIVTPQAATRGCHGSLLRSAIDPALPWR